VGGSLGMDFGSNFCQEVNHFPSFGHNIYRLSLQNAESLTSRLHSLFCGHRHTRCITTKVDLYIVPRCRSRQATRMEQAVHASRLIWQCEFACVLLFATTKSYT
jgi:hypothetical protein